MGKIKKKDWRSWCYENGGVCLVWIFFCAIGLIIFLNINDGLGFWAPIGVGFAILTGLAVIFRKKIWRFMQTHRKLMVALAAMLILVGLGARIWMVNLGDRIVSVNGNSDTSVHWYGAREIAENGSESEYIGIHEKIFPHLMGYTGTLAFFMKLWGTNFATVVWSNILFDVITMVALYILFHSWKKSRSAGLMAAAFWAINPLEIMACALPMALVATNMMMAVGILLVYWLFMRRDNFAWGSILALATGVILAVGNAYRPFFIVLVIAVIVYWIYLWIGKKIALKKMVPEMVLLLVGFAGVWGLVLPRLYTIINPYYEGDGAKPGWNTFVGSNYETKGRWSEDEWKTFMDEIWAVSPTSEGVAAVQDEFFDKAMERYQELAVSGKIVPHLLNKMEVLFAGIEGNTWGGLHEMFGIDWRKSAKVKVVQNTMIMYYVAILMVIGWACVVILRRKKKGVLEYLQRNQFVVFLMIVFVGIFLASLLVEVMDRYIFLMLVPLVAIAGGFVIDAVQFREQESNVMRTKKGLKQ